MSNESQTLLGIFQEILAASGNSSDKYINETRILSVLRERASKVHNENFNPILAKVAHALNNKPDTCTYCVGEFWNAIKVYNSIHGYVSLIVSSFILYLTSRCQQHR